MQNPIEEIKKKIDIVDYIGSFVTLKKAGRNFKAVCPFHQEKTPSFVISPDRQIWHCFGACQDGGDIFKFLMKWENISFPEAIKELANKAGVSLTGTYSEDKTWKKKERLFALNLLASEFFQYILNKNKYGEKGRKYLRERGINQKIAKKFSLGYAPNSWNSLLNFITKKNYSLEEINSVGLIIRGQSGFYDRFRGRLMFPIINSRNQIVGFSGRILNAGKNEAKYINTPETILYHKRETLYGINSAKEAIKKLGQVILVEGEFDVITPYSYGIENIVAIKGSAVTKEQLMLLKRYTKRINLFLDADKAGQEATKKALKEAEDFDFDIGVITINFAKDPDEAIKKDLEKFKKAIDTPVPIYDFIIDINKKKYNLETPYGKKRFAENVVSFIEKINNPVIYSYYIQKVSTLLGVSSSSIRSLISQLRYQKKKKTTFAKKYKKKRTPSREALIEGYILSTILQNKNPYKILKRVFSVLDVKDFLIPSQQKIVTNFLESSKKNKKFSAKEFAKKLPPELIPVFDKLYLSLPNEDQSTPNKLEMLILEAKKLSLKRQLSSFLKGEYNKKIVVEIGKKLNQVEKKLRSL